ncbi:MAG TPA: sugar porter family MFS transporter [Candidatus Acidoferrum sp.]|nr:sugar porter family MFS transporter [Candidatus Acidoferrum sp.]
MSTTDQSAAPPLRPGGSAEHSALNSTLLKAAFVGALGGLLFGFDTAVIAGTEPSLITFYHLTAWSTGFTVSIALIGTVIGAMTSGVIGQKFGSREVLRILALLYLASALGCAFAPTWTVLLAARFIGGLGIGGSSVLGPVYIAEISPAKWRGRLVGLFQINIVAGILMAYLSNYLIARAITSTSDWRWMFGVAAIPAALFLIFLFGIPQSPRWLATQDRAEEARSVLQSIGSPNPDDELREIVASIHLDRSTASEPLFSRKYAFPIFIAVTMGMFNQLAGINAILYYLTPIFTYAGFTTMSAELQSVAVGGMNFVATFLGMALIDKLGRKTLLLIGSAGMVGCLSGVAYVFLTNSHQSSLLWLLLVYIAFFSISQGAVIWVYIGEVFPNRVRAKGQSLGSSAHWITNAIISFAFPKLAAFSHGYPFVFFAAMTLVQFFIVLFIYPETKGISLEEMQHKLGIE